MALDKIEVSRLKQLLLDERQEVMEALETFGLSRSTHGGYDPNFADISQVTAEKGEADALIQPLKETLVEIDEALNRIAEGTYGLCLKCGKEIPLERLEAVPKTKYCTPCANLLR
jgi:RNA polymerase-binding transcription factor DksA